MALVTFSLKKKKDLRSADILRNTGGKNGE